MVIVQEAPGASEPGHVVESGKSVRSESVILEMRMAAVPVLFKVITSVVLDVDPTVVAGNEKLV